MRISARFETNTRDVSLALTESHFKILPSKKLYIPITPEFTSRWSWLDTVFVDRGSVIIYMVYSECTWSVEASSCSVSVIFSHEQRRRSPIRVSRITSSFSWSSAKTPQALVCWNGRFAIWCWMMSMWMVYVLHSVYRTRLLICISDVFTILLGWLVRSLLSS